jgi:hypothetical protein
MMARAKGSGFTSKRAAAVAGKKKLKKKRGKTSAAGVKTAKVFR